MGCRLLNSVTCIIIIIIHVPGVIIIHSVVASQKLSNIYAYVVSFTECRCMTRISFTNNLTVHRSGYMYRSWHCVLYIQHIHHTE